MGKREIKFRKSTDANKEKQESSSEIHHRTNPLCFQGFVYVSNSLAIAVELNFSRVDLKQTHKVAGFGGEGKTNSLEEAEMRKAKSTKSTKL